MTDDLNPVQYPNGKLNVEDEGVLEKVSQEVRELCLAFPAPGIRIE